jgi:hypothetical protein
MSKKSCSSDDVDDGVGGHKDTREDGKDVCAAMGCANAGTKICGGCMQVRSQPRLGCVAWPAMSKRATHPLAHMP